MNILDFNNTLSYIKRRQQKYLPRIKKAVAPHDGSLHIEARYKLPDGGNLKEPITACLLGRIWDLLRSEVVWKNDNNAWVFKTVEIMICVYATGIK